MSDYELRVESLEPCEDCDKGGPHPLYAFDGKLAVLCARCCDARIAAEDAAKERRMLDEWGTLRDRRTA